MLQTRLSLYLSNCRYSLIYARAVASGDSSRKTEFVPTLRRWRVDLLANWRIPAASALQDGSTSRLLFGCSPTSSRSSQYNTGNPAASASVMTIGWLSKRYDARMNISASRRCCTISCWLPTCPVNVMRVSPRAWARRAASSAPSPIMTSSLSGISAWRNASITTARRFYLTMRLTLTNRNACDVRLRLVFAIIASNERL